MGVRPIVVVVGSCIADLAFQVTRLPRVGETILSHGLTASLGGKGFNQAVGLARLGVATSLVSAIGEDEPGGAFFRRCGEEGVSTDHLKTVKGRPTGIGVPLILPDGRNAIVVAPSAALCLNSGDIEVASLAIGGARALLLQLESSEESVLAALRTARRHGVVAVLNPAPVMPFAEPALLECDVVVPNETEASAILGEPVRVGREVVACRALRGLGPSVAVITLGERGAAISCADFEGVVSGFEVESIDTTGAGDAFCSGLTYGRVVGMGWQESMRFANACGALATTEVGAGPAMPRLDAVNELLGRSVVVDD